MIFWPSPLRKSITYSLHSPVHKIRILINDINELRWNDGDRLMEKNLSNHDQNHLIGEILIMYYEMHVETEIHSFMKKN